MGAAAQTARRRSSLLPTHGRALHLFAPHASATPQLPPPGRAAQSTEWVGPGAASFAPRLAPEDARLGRPPVQRAGRSGSGSRNRRRVPLPPLVPHRAGTMADVDVDALKAGSIAAFLELLSNVSCVDNRVTAWCARAAHSGARLPPLPQERGVRLRCNLPDTLVLHDGQPLAWFATSKVPKGQRDSACTTSLPISRSPSAGPGALVPQHLPPRNTSPAALAPGGLRGAARRGASGV